MTDTKPRLLLENYDCQVITEGIGLEKQIYISGIFQEGGVRNQNGRIYPSEVLIPEVQRYLEKYVKTGRAIGELDHPACYFSDNFEILTENGWKFFDEIKIEDKVATLNKDTSEIEYHPIENKIETKVEKYTAIRIKGRNINVLVTPNHRFLVLDRKNNSLFITAKQLLDEYNNKTYSTSNYRIPKTGNWFGKDDEYFVLSGVKDSKRNYKKYHKDYSVDISIPTKTFMSFMGIWLAEGHIDKNKDTIYISQKDEIKTKMIEEMLMSFPKEMTWNKRTNIFGKTVFYLTDARLHAFLLPLGNLYNKYIPHELKQLSSSMLEELFYWFNVGDGRRRDYSSNCSKNNMKHVFSVSKRLVDDLHEILIKTGGSGNITIQTCVEDYIFSGRWIKKENKKPLYILNYSTTKDIYLDFRFINITEEIIDADIAKCISVKNENFYARIDGKAFWSGNSPTINLDRVSHKIVDLRIEGNKIYGKALIGDTECGKKAKKILEMGVKLGVSSRSLGTLDMGNRVNELQLITWDIVHEPSVSTALMENLTESKEFEWLRDEDKNFKSLTEGFKKTQTTKYLSSEEKKIVIETMFENFLKKLL